MGEGQPLFGEVRVPGAAELWGLDYRSSRDIYADFGGLSILGGRRISG